MKVNNNQVMCHLSVKLSDTFDQNPPCTFDNIRGNPFQRKMLSRLDLESKGQGHSKNQSQCPREQKTCLPPKKFVQGSLSNWCDADICKTICRHNNFIGKK